MPRVDYNQLRTAIDGLIQTALTTGIQTDLNRRDANSAFEAYIFTLVLTAIERVFQRGTTSGISTIELICNNTTIAERIFSAGGITTNGSSNAFVFRGAPGHIQNQTCGYALCSFQNGKQFEVHVDVEYHGNSTAKHEVDISILDAREAHRCRTRNSPVRFPKARYLRFAFECKRYSGRLPTHLIRTFTGLIDDLGKLQYATLVSNMNSRMIRRFCDGKATRPRFSHNVVPNSQRERAFIREVATQLDMYL